MALGKCFRGDPILYPDVGSSAVPLSPSICDALCLAFSDGGAIGFIRPVANPGEKFTGGATETSETGGGVPVSVNPSLSDAICFAFSEGATTARVRPVTKPITGGEEDEGAPNEMVELAGSISSNSVMSLGLCNGVPGSESSGRVRVSRRCDIGGGSGIGVWRALLMECVEADSEVKRERGVISALAVDAPEVSSSAVGSMTEVASACKASSSSFSESCSLLL
jgi:hypothetical protein